jgi:large subunit ribosomal protein L1
MRFMKKIGKRIKKARELMPKTQVSLEKAIQALHKYKELGAKFDESIEVIFKIGVDPRQSNQMVRGSVAMPNGLGKTKRIAVFAQPDRHKEVLAAGADIVGFEDLIEEVKAGRDDFDVCIASPDMMPKLGVLGKVLGTKGKMPNPKLGTVSTDLPFAIQQAKKGMVEFRVEKGALIHAGVGKLSFTSNLLIENIKALYEAVVAAKPSESKGVYMQKMYLSTSQGPSVAVDVSTVI